MERTLQENSSIIDRMTRNSLLSVLGWGMIGGLAATLVMDLVLMGALSVLGLPILTCFSIVGNTVARFLAIPNMDAGSVIRLGAATHYLIGPLIGMIFGVVVSRVNALRVNSLKKTILLAILFVELLSQPLLALTPILLKMTAPAILQWYIGSFVMHCIAGIILGEVVGRGLRLTTSVDRS
jgi:hypothetical protein